MDVDTDDVGEALVLVELDGAKWFAERSADLDLAPCVDPYVRSTGDMVTDALMRSVWAVDPVARFLDSAWSLHAFAVDLATAERALAQVNENAAQADERSGIN